MHMPISHIPTLGAVTLCLVASSCSLRNQSAQVSSKTPDTAGLVFVGDIMLADRPGQCIARGMDPFNEFAGILKASDAMRQYRNPQERKTPFYQISYTHQMKSRTEYLHKENLKAVRVETANFKRFRKLVDQWADAAPKLSQLKTRLGLHSGES